MTNAPDTTAAPTQEAVMRARAVLSTEIHRLREKAALWGENSTGGRLMVSDSAELETVRRFLVPYDYPSAREASAP